MDGSEAEPPARAARALTAVVIGRVQGVGFRFATRRVAVGLGVAGWVRNRDDGAVEVWAQGSEESVAQLTTFLHRGPPSALVTSVETTATGPDPTLAGFEIRY